MFEAGCLLKAGSRLRHAPRKHAKSYSDAQLDSVLPVFQAAVHSSRKTAAEVAGLWGSTIPAYTCQILETHVLKWTLTDLVSHKALSPRFTISKCGTAVLPSLGSGWNRLVPSCSGYFSVGHGMSTIMKSVTVTNEEWRASSHRLLKPT